MENIFQPKSEVDSYKWPEEHRSKRVEVPGFHTLLCKMLSTSTYRIVDFPNNPKGYVYDRK